MLNFLDRLVNIEEADESITVQLMRVWFWNDSQLAWNPDDFDNVTYIHVPREAIWLPDLFVFELQVQLKQAY